MTEDQDTDKALILARLSRVEGQIRGIQRMIEANRTCEAIITQLMAARAALDRASLLILSRHLERCLIEQAREPNREQLDRILGFLVKLPLAASEPTEQG